MSGKRRAFGLKERRDEERVSGELERPDFPGRSARRDAQAAAQERVQECRIQAVAAAVALASRSASGMARCAVTLAS